MRPIQLYHPSKSLNAHACSCNAFACNKLNIIQKCTECSSTQLRDQT